MLSRREAGMLVGLVGGLGWRRYFDGVWNQHSGKPLERYLKEAPTPHQDSARRRISPRGWHRNILALHPSYWVPAATQQARPALVK